MPCDQRITVVARLERADQATLVKALTALGLDPVVLGSAIQFNGGRFQDGQLVLAGYGYGSRLDEKVSQIKQAYSVAVVKQAAAQWGWTVEDAESTIKGGQAFEVRQEG